MAIINGTSAGETITGTSGIDLIHGLGGNDIINAIGGSDDLYGDDGNDTLNGSDGNDDLFGGAGTDTLNGGAGNDRYFVDAADIAAGDVINESSGNGIDTVMAGATYSIANKINVENVTLYLAGASDATGNAGDNKLTGNVANNWLYGLDGVDILNAGGGNDRLYGGDGKDVLTGGADADVFYFSSASESGVTAETRDTIMDFTEIASGAAGSQLDKIEMGFIPDAPGQFLGTGHFTGQSGETRYYQLNGQTYVLTDTDGDAVADFNLRLDGLHTLVAQDFL